MDKLVPTAAFNARIAALIAADTTLLASADPVTIKLTTNIFTPSPTLTLGDMAFAAFTGSAAKTVTTGTQVVIHDEESDGFGVQMKEPVGGFNFVCTAAPGTPEVITGYAVILNNATLIATARLDADKEVRVVGDYVDLPAIFGFLPAQPFADQAGGEE